MRVFITGVAGFLGSHLALRHLARGDVVWGVDNHCTSMGPRSAHMQQLLANEMFCFREVDVCAMDKVGFFTPPFDLIYNFACPASPPKYQALPVETMLTCVVGTHNVLQLAHRWNAVVVHASTSEVYGDPAVSPQDESYRGHVNPYGPRACYDEGKRAAEALCYDYRHKHGVDTRIVRIFNTFGPHMDPRDGRVVTNFILQALRNEPITVYGDGTQTRSFCYVDDLVRGVIGLGELSVDSGVPVNVGNPHEFTVRQLAETVLRITGSTSTIRSIAPQPVDDPLRRRPCINAAGVRLGWTPQIDLEQGLIRMVDYMKAFVDT